MSALGTDLVYDSGDYTGLLDKSLARFGWDTANADCKRRRAKGEAVGLGISLLCREDRARPEGHRARQRRAVRRR